MDVIVDLDGTLCNIEHRLHFIQDGGRGLDAFFAACVDDPPIETMVEFVRCAMDAHFIIFASGRSDSVRHLTQRWLLKHLGVSGPLFMRQHGDHRPDHEVKLGLLGQIRASGFDPKIAIDNRTKVVKMWREHGITCLQCADGTTRR